MTEKSVLQKMLVKEGHTILLIAPPSNVETILGKIPAARIWRNEPGAYPDVIAAFLENRQALETVLPRIQAVLKPAALLWLCYHKGTSKIKTDINRDTINAYCMANGLRGIAMVSMDDDWSALRLRPFQPGDEAAA